MFISVSVSLGRQCAQSHNYPARLVKQAIVFSRVHLCVCLCVSVKAGTSELHKFT